MKNLVLLHLTHLINESELNNLVRNLDLPKVQAELLASRLKQWILLQSGINVCSFRTLQQSFAQFVNIKGELVYCTDVNGINVRTWRLSQTRRIKTVH